MSQDYVTFKIGEQLFGLRVEAVRDVLPSQRMTPVPMAAREIAGVINLRGRIVTVLDLPKRLGQAGVTREKPMNIVVENQGESYSFLVDEIGDVCSLDQDTFEPNPPHMDAAWRALSEGVHRLDGILLVILDLNRCMDLVTASA